MAPEDSNDDVSIDPVTISDSEPVSATLKSPSKLKSTTAVTHPLILGGFVVGLDCGQ